ncbi:MAG: 3-oxoacyl-ACP reductase [Armatimonadetes bacterium]|nr:MAG: 3-oxoacyl-ACP reductase [Armatimonadota bacterium]
MGSSRVLVTGSSRGIGRAIARSLAEAGWQVALHGSHPGKDLEESERAVGNQAAGSYAADLSDPSRADSLLAQVVADGPLHALVNNAGVYLPLDFAGASEAVFETNLRKTFAVNFEAPVRLIRAAIPHFRVQGGGKVLNVSSRVGFKGEAGATTYAASKAALTNLTRSLAAELASQNVLFFGIAPGWTETAMAREGMEDRLGEILAGIPLGRMATPDDCAAACRFLLSEEARYLSGVVIDINGASYFH